MNEKEQLAALTKNEKLFLSRRTCMLCDTPLHRPWCGAIYSKCSEEKRVKRRERCLETYKPRKKKA